MVSYNIRGFQNSVDKNSCMMFFLDIAINIYNIYMHVWILFEDK